MVKNPPYNARDLGLIPGQGTKVPHAMWQLSPRATTAELAHLNERAHVLQTTEPWSMHTTTREKPLHRSERPHMLQLSPDTA